jgi:hypothetical protein
MLRARRLAPMLIATAFVVLVALLPLSCEAEAIADSTYELGQGGDAVIAHFLAEDLARVDFQFNVTNGGAIDLLLLDENGYEAYRLGSNISGLPGSIMDQTQGQASVEGLDSGQEYYIILDNSNFPYGGAIPTGKVVVDCSVGGQNIASISSNYDWIVIALALVIVLFIVIVVLLARSGLAEKEPGAKQVGLERKYCPKCGEIVQTWVHKCPNCGHEW